MTQLSLERRVEIETPEQTVLSYTLAGVGSRASAAIIDLIIIVVIELAITILLSESASVFRGRSSGAQRMSSRPIRRRRTITSSGSIRMPLARRRCAPDGIAPARRWFCRRWQFWIRLLAQLDVAGAGP